ncbi:hypothetical protein IQ252_26555, partial [Tychonema sp. LEGE 07203]|nr:hypothetical protein [Tychonema sp. LEGE 07203]
MTSSFKVGTPPLLELGFLDVAKDWGAAAGGGAAGGGGAGGNPAALGMP